MAAKERRRLRRLSFPVERSKSDPIRALGPLLYLLRREFRCANPNRGYLEDVQHTNRCASGIEECQVDAVRDGASVHDAIETTGFHELAQILARQVVNVDRARNHGPRKLIAPAN